MTAIVWIVVRNVPNRLELTHDCNGDRVFARLAIVALIVFEPAEDLIEIVMQHRNELGVSVRRRPL
ncbi:hypothetical protein WS54_14195 [Burkholderia sp. NRF60-BP8]|nr:hypothetical protein WS54_14195 [Burkholderia sp. NRF60-BP8]